jgi:hypothetical protein
MDFARRLHLQRFVRPHVVEVRSPLVACSLLVRPSLSSVGAKLPLHVCVHPRVAAVVLRAARPAPYEPRGSVRGRELRKCAIDRRREVVRNRHSTKDS